MNLIAMITVKSAVLLSGLRFFVLIRPLRFAAVSNIPDPQLQPYKTFTPIIAPH